MFTTLLESGMRRKAHPRWLSASAIVHLVLLAPAVMYSRSARDETVEADAIPDVVWIAPRQADPAAGSSGGRSDSRAEQTTSAPAMPRFDDVPAVDLPDMPVPGIGEPITGGDFRPSITGTATQGGRSLSSGAGDGARWAAEVEKVALPLPGNAVPAYPGALRSAGIEGSVTLRFVIDTTGAVERGSAIVVRTDHELFAAAALRALAKHRFLPAEVGGRKVRMLVEQRFEFAMSAVRD